MVRSILSVDLGSVQDYTAISFTEVVSRFQEKGRTIIVGESQLPIVNEVTCRMLERIELGVSYPDIIERIRVIMSDPDIFGTAILVVDQTGCGIPVIQQMRKVPGLSPIGITITGGNTVNPTEGGYNVPKKDLVSSLQLLFQSRRLKFSKGLSHKDALIHELRNFKVKQKKQSESYEAWRETDHDDLVLSLAMAAWMHKRMHGETVLMDNKSDVERGYNVLRHGTQSNKRTPKWDNKRSNTRDDLRWQ